MFNKAQVSSFNSNYQAIGGLSAGDFQTHTTLYSGPDPSDPKRALIRKLVQVNDNTYCYEEIKITPNQGDRKPTVHSQLYRVQGFDLQEKVTPEELQIRGSYRPLPNVLGFSLYSRSTADGNHLFITENTLYKRNGGKWLEWFRDMRDRRDMMHYLQMRWKGNKHHN